MQEKECNKCGRPIKREDFFTEHEGEEICWDCSLLLKKITMAEYCFAYDVEII